MAPVTLAGSTEAGEVAVYLVEEDLGLYWVRTRVRTRVRTVVTGLRQGRRAHKV